ncbi:MAG: diguanylate cyclase, partial [Candidatus Omnitrophota bacterium]
MQDANLIYIDELTDLYNRRYLFTYLPKELEMAESQKYNVWVLMLDLDGFKAINDTYGHLCADELLKDIAKILKDNTKFEDKKIRYAGDEFTIIISNTDTKGIPEIAKRLVDKVSAYRYNDPRSQKEIALTVSLGIAGYPQDAIEARKLVELADKALYISKQKGKNCFSSASEITSEMIWKKDILERFPCPVLVGRENEFTSLKNFFKLTPQTKKADIVFISGELGSGKSRLLGEFGRFVSADNSFICAQAKCAEKYMLEPYRILTDVLYGYFSKSDNLPEGLFEGFSKDELSVLFSLLPGLADMAGLIQDKDKSPHDPLKFRDSLIKLLVNLSLKKSPLAILLDDFQYVDEQTMELLLCLAKNKGQAAVLIVCAFSLADVSQDIVFKPEAFSGCGEAVILSSLSEEGVKNMILAIFADISLTVDFYDL